MKNLNALVKEELSKFNSVEWTDPMCMSEEKITDLLRKVAETALKECRPGEKGIPHKPEDFEEEEENTISKKSFRNMTKTFENMAAAEFSYPYNRCLSDYDERVNQFLK